MDAIKSLKYILLFFRFLGILPFRLVRINKSLIFVKSRRFLLYSKIIFFFFGLLQIHIIWFLLCVHLEAIPGLSAKAVFIVAFSSVTTSMLATIYCILKQKDTFLYYLNKINSLFSSLSQRSLEKIKIFYKLCCVLILVCIPIAMAADFYFRDSNHVSNLLKTATIFHHPIIFMATYYVTIWEVKMFVQLFFLFANLLRFYYKEIRKDLRKFVNKKDERFWLAYLRDLRIQDLEVQEFFNFLQSFFIPVVSIQLSWGLSTMLFAITMSTELGVQPLTRGLWLSFISWDIFFILGICHDTERQNKKTSRYLNHLLIQWGDKEIRKEIELFSLQILHRKIQFQSLLYSKMNFTFLCTIISSLTTYTVILLQFQQNGEKTNLTSTSNHCIQFLAQNLSTQ